MSDIDWGRNLSGREIAAVVLLAVVVFGVLLSGGISPRPREQARRSYCQSNMHELGIALQTYTSDFDGKLPSSALVHHSRKWNEADFVAFGTKVGKLPPVKQRQTYYEVIYEYIKNKEIVFCPSDPVMKQHNRSSRCSYSWKLALDKAWYGEDCRKPCRLIEKDFPYASDTIMLYESRGFHTGNEPLGNGVPINVAYLDGHVRWICLTNTPSAVVNNSEGEPMYFNYNYAANKGLPDETVMARWGDPAVYGDKF